MTVEAQDLELARAVLGRDRKAAAELVERYSGPLLAYVRARLLPRQDNVEDVVQEVFVAAWQCLPGYRGGSTLGAWIMGIARHKVEDHYRRTLRGLAGWDESVAEGLEDGAPPVDEDLDRQQRSQAARRVLADMPEHYATVLLWRYWEGRSSREIAEASQRTEKAVERLLARARDNFRRRWQDVARRAG